MHINSDLHKRWPTVKSSTVVYLPPKKKPISFSFVNNQVYLAATLYVDNKPVLSFGMNTMGACNE